MQFCPACGFSFNQQPNQPYTTNQYGPQPYGPPAYPRKSVAVALVLSFFFAGLGQLYVGKILRGVVYIIIFVGLSAASFALTMNIDYNDLNAINNLVSSPLFIGVTLASLGLWAFNMYDAYRLAKKYNDASMRNDLPRFMKGF
jgi:TM2 domain-containing membrane protein YozV